MNEQPSNLILDVQELISATEGLIQSCRNLLSDCVCKGNGLYQSYCIQIGDLTFRNDPPELMACSDPKCVRARECIAEAEKALESIHKSLNAESNTPNLSCPCAYGKPCDPRCSCVKRGSSIGCERCCSYGSEEQRKESAGRLICMERMSTNEDE